MNLCTHVTDINSCLFLIYLKTYIRHNETIVNPIEYLTDFLMLKRVTLLTQLTSFTGIMCDLHDLCGNTTQL